MMTLPAIRPTTVSSSTCRSRPVEGAVVQEVIVGTAEADAGGDVVRLPYPAGLEFDGPWKVNTGGGIIAFLEMAVDSALGAGDLRGIGHDMIEVLSPAEALEMMRSVL